jgi:hypothetical protein
MPLARSASIEARVWESAALGRPVAYAGDDAELLTQQLREQLHGKKYEDMLATSLVLGRIGLSTAPGQLAKTTALLGRLPRTYAAYVQEHAVGSRASDASMPRRLCATALRR